MAVRFSTPANRHFDSLGNPLEGGKLNFYEDDGGTTQKTTYSDNDLGTANANPVILSKSGLEPNIFLDGSYRVVLTDKNDVQIWERDNVNAGGSEATAFEIWMSSISYGGGADNIVTGSDGNYYISLQDPNLSNDPTTSPTFWEQIKFIGVWNTNVTYAIDDVVQGSDGSLYSALVSQSGNTPVDDITNWKSVSSNANLKDYGEIVNVIGSTGGGTQDIDLELGNVVSLTVDTSANTFTFSNPTPTTILCGFTMIMTNGGSQTVNWPASVDFPSGLAPVLTASGVDVLTFFTIDAGTIWYGFHSGVDMS